MNSTIYKKEMDNKYYKVNINDFNSNLLTISQVEKTDKFNVKYNDKLMKIYSLSKHDSYGIKKINNIYKISCIFKDDDYKNIYIEIYKKIKKILNKNKDIIIKHPLGDDNGKTIDFTIDKYTNIINITQNDAIPIFYKDLETLLYKNIEFLPIIIFPYIEIKNNVIFLNFILKELYIKIKYEYNFNEINNIFQNISLSENETKLNNNSKGKGKIYNLDNNN